MKHIDKRNKALICTSFPPPFEFPCLLFLSAAPCCPSEFRAVFTSSDTVRVTWAAVRGADLYETRAAGGRGVVLCRDTAPACTLSALQCSTAYNISVYSFSEARGSSASCAPHYVPTGTVSTHLPSAEEIVITNRGDSWMKNITGALNYCFTKFTDKNFKKTPKNQQLQNCKSLRIHCKEGNLYQISIESF